MPEKVGVMEAIEKTSQIVDSYKKEMLNDARMFSMRVSPETTPKTISEYHQVIGTSKHFREIKEAADELDDELSPSSKEHFFDVATFLEIYQYLYLINDKENPAEVYSGKNEGIRVSTSKVLSSVEESLDHWKKADRTDRGTVSRTEGRVCPDLNLLTLTYFPKEDVPKLENKIESDLTKENLEIDTSLVEALKRFPKQFNRRTAHYEHKNRLDFYYIYTHEFSHAYIGEKTPTKDSAFNEATAQFISRYLRAAEFDKKGIPSNTKLEGINFEHTPKTYSGYDESYYNGASEDIYTIIEFMKLRATEKILSLGAIESKNFSLIDWLIKEEIRSVNECKQEKGKVNRKGILRHYIPVQLKQEIREVNQVIENELNPLISETEEFLEQFEEYQDFHYHEWNSKINEILKNAVSQNLSGSEFEQHLEGESEQRSKLHDIESRIETDIEELQVVSKSDHIKLDEISEVIENLPSNVDAAEALEIIKGKIKPGQEELKDLKEDLKDLEELKSKVEEQRDKDKAEITKVSHQGYSTDIRELEQKEMQTVNELIKHLGKLEQESRKVRKDIENIEKKYSQKK